MALRSNPDETQAWARKLMQAQQIPSQLKNLIRSVDDLLPAYNNFVEAERINLGGGDPAKVKKLCETCLACLPSFAPAHAMLGLTYFKLGNIPSALAELKKAIESDPFIPPAYQLRAIIYYNEMTDDGMRKCLADVEEAIGLAPDNLDNLIIRGRALVLLKSAREALPDLEKVHAKGKMKDPKDLLFLAAAKCAAGAIEEAKKLATQAISQDPQLIKLITPLAGPFSDLAFHFMGDFSKDLNK